jgi:hypothetical protein
MQVDEDARRLRAVSKAVRRSLMPIPCAWQAIGDLACGVAAARSWPLLMLRSERGSYGRGNSFEKKNDVQMFVSSFSNLLILTNVDSQGMIKRMVL